MTCFSLGAGYVSPISEPDSPTSTRPFAYWEGASTTTRGSWKGQAWKVDIRWDQPWTKFGVLNMYQQLGTLTDWTSCTSGASGSGSGSSFAIAPFIPQGEMCHARFFSVSISLQLLWDHLHQCDWVFSSVLLPKMSLRQANNLLVLDKPISRPLPFVKYFKMAVCGLAV